MLKRFGIGGVFLRIYLFAIGLMVLFFMSIVLVFALVLEPAADSGGLQLARFIAESLYRVSDDEDALEAGLASLRDEVRARVTIYSKDGEVLASNVDPPLPLPAADVMSSLSETPGMTQDLEMFVVTIRQRDRIVAYAVLQDIEPFETDIGPSALAIVLAILAALAWPMARSISLPLERLSGVVERFGAGSLDERSNSTRRDEIGVLARRFDTMADRIIALLSAEQQLMAGISHEFRTPLQRLRLALELVQDRSGSVSPKELDAIRADLDELSELVADVILASRLRTASAGTKSSLMRRDTVRVSELVAATVQRFSVHAGTGVLVEGHESASVRGDSRLLKRALLNLLYNAHSHSPSAESITVTWTRDDSAVVLRVIDRGPGIPEPLREKIFEAFFRGAPSRTGRGTGLGLALVKRIVEVHGGSIKVDDHSEGGAVFAIRLPVDRKLQAPGASASAASLPSERREDGSKTA